MTELYTPLLSHPEPASLGVSITGTGGGVTVIDTESPSEAPVEGVTSVFNSTDGSLWFWDGSEWIQHS